MARTRLVRGLLILAVAALATGFPATDATGGDAPESLGKLGEKALEKLPWKAHVLSANLSKRRPMAIAACYLMDRHLLVVSNIGRLYCLDRRNLEPRWVNTLRYPLARAPAEGATHFAFLMKDQRGANWVTTISKRTGAEGNRFPVRLPYAASSGVAVNASMIFVGSLGSPSNNKTVESVNLVSGRRGWGYRSTGMIWGDPQLDPGGDILIIAGDDGVITALSAGATAPNAETWIRDVHAAVRGSTSVTPAHVLVGSHDGVLYNLDLFSGGVNWLQGIDEPIRSAPCVFGNYKTVKRAAGVQGAAPIEVKVYVGMVFARNVKGLHAFDLRSGKALFADKRGGRALCRNGKHLLTCDSSLRVTIRDSSNGYAVTGTLNLGMFDLIPTNTDNGEIFACTADGYVVAAIPK